MSRANIREIRPRTGPERKARTWAAEAAIRMLMNNLHPDVAERPEDLVVYGGIGKAARDWASYDAIVATLERLEPDETLLVQSGKPVGVVRTHEDAPRVLIANSNLVPRWANWEHFRELDRKGLMMYGQMTAGSWIYIGSQGIVQGTYETFAEAGRQHYGGDLTGRWILTAGLGGMGGAQPLAAVMAGACCLAVECDPERIAFRLRTRYVDEAAADLDDALARIADWTSKGVAKSVAVEGNAADIFPELIKRGVRPDLVTDQTSAHDPVNGYLPSGWSLARWRETAARDPDAVADAARASMRIQVEAMAAFAKAGIPTVDYGNNIRQMAHDAGFADAFCFPGFVPAYIRPLFLPGRRPVPLGGAVRRSGGHRGHRRQGERADPGRPAPASMARHGRRANRISGPARAHLLGGAGRAPPSGTRLQRDGGFRRAQSPPSSSAATISIPARWRAPTGRPRR